MFTKSLLPFILFSLYPSKNCFLWEWIWSLLELDIFNYLWCLQGSPIMATNWLLGLPGENNPVWLKSWNSGENMFILNREEVGLKEIQKALSFLFFLRIWPKGQHFPTSGRSLYSSGTDEFWKQKNYKIIKILKP